YNMAPVSKASKSRKNMKENNEEKWKVHLQKERDRDRKRRQKLKETLSKDNALLEEMREKSRLRNKKSRVNKKIS
ncbi:hypothetical protein J6590_107810, partial [Homalodisca vitripennis]